MLQNPLVSPSSTGGVALVARISSDTHLDVSDVQGGVGRRVVERVDRHSIGSNDDEFLPLLLGGMLCSFAFPSPIPSIVVVACRVPGGTSM